MTTTDDSPTRDALSSTSLGLLEGVQGGDPAAWACLVHLYAPLVYAWCRRMGVAPAKAPEVVREVFATVTRHVTEFAGDGPRARFRSWLLSITRRRVAEYVRAAGRASDREGIEAECDTFRESPALTISGDVDTVPGEAALLWRRALEVVGAECEDRDWHASWRTVVEGLPPGGVAAELGMTVQAVYQAQYRVLRRVRQMLSELESEELD